MTKSKYIAAGRYGNLTAGKQVRIVRELQEMSQLDLARASGIAQPIISGIEHDRIQLGLERAKKLARALKVHPAVLLFPDWDDVTDAPSESTDEPIEAHRTSKRRSHVA